MQKITKMTLMWLHQVFAMLLFCVIVKETTGHKCSCVEEEVNCSSQTLTVFPANQIPDSCKSFKKIDLSNNKFESVPFYEIRSAETIIFSNNLLQELSSEYYLETKVLDVSRNRIQTIQMDNLRKLEELYASENSLNTNPEYLLGKCMNLGLLDMSKNHLNSLASVTKCRNLSRLEVSQNNITDLPKEFRYLTGLKFMNLSWNSMDILSYLPVNLENLTVSHNKLTRILSQFFESLNMLTNLDLSYNSLDQLDADTFKQMEVLNQLDLSHNTLSVVPPLQLSNEVRSVLLNGNKITSVNTNDVMKLLGKGDVQREVDMRANPIHNLDIGLHALVQHLDAAGAAVDIYHDCECINTTLGNATLLLCVIGQDRDSECWIDVARKTTTTEKTTSSEPVEEIEVTDGSRRNTSGAIISDNTESINATNIDIIHVSHFMSSLGAAKLSFLAFLLVTLLILIIVNCIVGDPVVDDRWWEEKVSDRRVT